MDTRQIEQQLTICNAMGVTLTGVLAIVSIEHVKLIGGDPETALMATRRILDDALERVQLGNTTPDGVRTDITADIHRRVAKELDKAEAIARRHLGLAAKSQSAH